MDSSYVVWSRTIGGLITKRYLDQQKTSRRRRHKMPTYTRDELYDWAVAQDIFHTIYQKWIDSGYDKNLCVSFDRSDDYQGYDLGRLTITTGYLNALKGSSDMRDGINNKRNKAVIQMTKDSVFVKEHHSMNQASRDSGADQAAISRCCNGKLKSTGGYTWAYK